MATAEKVLKPDFGSQKRHFIFTDEHDALRESIRNFAEKELAPHAEEWEETTFPNWVFERMGELGFLGLSYPEEYGGQGGDYYANLVLAEEIGAPQLRRPRDGRSPCTPTWPRRRSSCSAPRSRSSATSCRRSRARRSRCLGITEPDAGSDVAGHQDPRCARRRRVGHQRLEDLHHERPPRRLHRARHEDRPGRRLRRLHALHRRHGPAGRDPREEAREARDARLRHGAARVPGRARARPTRCWARSARASTTSCGSSRASG